MPLLAADYPGGHRIPSNTAALAGIVSIGVNRDLLLLVPMRHKRLLLQAFQR